MEQADWQRRAYALAIDAHIAALCVLTAYLAGLATGELVGESAGRAVAVVGYTLAAAVTYYNRCVRPSIDGQTWGRSVLGIAVVSQRSLQPVNVRTAMLRDMAHLVDLALAGLGFLLPLVDRRGQTIADKVVGTITIDMRPSAPTALEGGLG